MLWQYLFTLSLAAIVVAGIAVFAWRHRQARGALPFMGIMVSLLIWLVGNIFELSSFDLASKFFWTRVQFIGVVAVPVVWWLFALAYAGRENWLTRRYKILYWVLPVISILLIWTNEWHHLVWRSLALVTDRAVYGVSYERAVWFWIHTLYSYLLIMGGLFLMAMEYLRGNALQKRQSGMILLGVSVPLITNAVVIFGYNPFVPLDLTPFAFTITGIFMATALFQFRLLDIVPVARSAVIESMTDAVLALDMENRVIDLNPAMCHLLNAEKRVILGKAAIDVLHPWPDLIAEFGETTEAQAEISLMLGRMTYFDLRISALYDQDEQQIGRLIVLRDITERKLAEDALREQKQLFENLVAVARATAEKPALEATLRNVLNVSMGLTGAERGSLFLLDADRNVVQKILARGETPPIEESFLVGRAMDRGLAGWVVAHETPAKVDDVFQDERWIPLADETYQPRSAMVVPIVGGGEIVGILTLEHARVKHFGDDHLALIQSACDQMALTLRNAQMFEAQRLLAEREATLNQVLKAIGGHLEPESVMQAAVDTIAAFTEWVSVTVLLPDQAGENLRAIAVGGHDPIPEGRIIPVEKGISGRAFSEGCSIYVPSVNEDDDYEAGNQTTLSEVCVPLRRGQQILGVLDVGSDRINGFRSGDVRLIESMAEAVALALENARLFADAVRAKEAAEDANLAKTDFISMVAHELKIPMTAIKGYAAVLADGTAGPVLEDQRRYLGIIAGNVDRMTTLVSDLADISRIEAGRVRLDLAETRLEDVLSEVVGTYQNRIEAKGHELIVRIPANLPKLWVDPVRMGQILTNLLSNAVKYMQAGGTVQVVASVEAVNQGANQRRMVVVSVIDSGAGIKQEEQDQIFAKFFRSRDKAIRSETGTGLGLNITKLLVELQGGEIWFDSKFGEGSTFSFRLPCVEETPDH